MSLAATYEGFKIKDNVSPPPLTMTGHILGSDLLPLGVFFIREKRAGNSDGVTMALPIAVGLKVSWLAEPGILYVDGAVVPVGSAFEETSGTGRYKKDEEVDTTTVMPEEVTEALGGSLKVEFTNFVNNYFAAVKRAVAVPGETVASLQEKLCRAFSEPEFHPTNSESEMAATIKAHRAERREAAKKPAKNDD